MDAYATPTLEPVEPVVLDSTQWPPDHFGVLAWRQQQLFNCRRNPELRVGAKTHYKDNPVDFINHWMLTYDPRNAQAGRSTTVPFVLFQRQAEFIDFLVGCINDQECGLVEKSRDMGATWLAVAVTLWLWLFREGVAIGWGTRSQDMLDVSGVMDSISEKMRWAVRMLPVELLPRGFNPKEHMPYARLINPENGSAVSGDIGDNIGRGGRNLCYWVDEAAHLTHQELVDAALSENTRCRIDISSVNGYGNCSIVKPAFL
jgi:hypothetical protein